MNSYDVIVIGAGPAGLGAAIEARRHGASVLLLDENSRPGGQLFKQIHKFFGSEEHPAKQLMAIIAISKIGRSFLIRKPMLYLRNLFYRLFVRRTVG